MLSEASGNALVKTAFKSVKPFLRLAYTNVGQTNKNSKIIVLLCSQSYNSLFNISSIYILRSVYF